MAQKCGKRSLQHSNQINLKCSSPGLSQSMSNGKGFPSGLKTSSDSETDCRRSKRFRSKVLNFWDFERLSFLETEEGTKPVIIKDIPGEGTIILHDQDCTEESKMPLISNFSKNKPFNTIKSNETNSQHSSSVRSKEPKAKHKEKMLFTKKSCYSESSKAVTFDVDSKPQKKIELDTQSPCKTPNKSFQTSTTGAVPRRTRKYQQQNQVLKTKSLNCPQMSDSNPKQKQMSMSSVPSNEKNEEKLDNSSIATNNSNSETQHSSVMKTKMIEGANISNLQPLDILVNKQTENEVRKSRRVELRQLRATEAMKDVSKLQQSAGETKKSVSPKTSPSNGSLHTPDDALDSEAGKNSKEEETSAGDGPATGRDDLVRGKDLVFHGFNKPSNSSATTGEYALAKGGAHGGVETFFLHLTKGSIGFNVPKDMKVFVVKGCGHCCEIVNGATTMVNVLFCGAETIVKNGTTLMVSVDDNCPELILCLLLYSA